MNVEYNDVTKNQICFHLFFSEKAPQVTSVPTTSGEGYLAYLRVGVVSVSLSARLRLPTIMTHPRARPYIALVHSIK